MASFVDTWGLRLALAEWFPPFWWFVALGCGFVWGALGTFVSFASSRWALPWFALLLSGVRVSVWFFLEEHCLRCFVVWAPFCGAVAVWALLLAEASFV